jgi:hypothetical protein
MAEISFDFVQLFEPFSMNLFNISSSHPTAMICLIRPHGAFNCCNIWDLPMYVEIFRGFPKKSMTLISHIFGPKWLKIEQKINLTNLKFSL